MNKIIEQSVKIKKKVVESDEKEEGIRKILNYGHTYGHAVERLSGYKHPHGYAISIGMVLENKIAVKKKFLSTKDSERIKKLLKKAGLPVITMQIPKLTDLKSDKKRTGNFIKMPLPTAIGKTRIYNLSL